MSEPRVLVLHNRYRVHGGEERAVDLLLTALRGAGVVHRALLRDSAETGRARTAGSLLRGRDRRGLSLRRALLSLPRAAHATGARAQLPRLGARGRGIRNGARGAPARGA